MTVRELIEKLSTLNPEAEVHYPTCRHCWGLGDSTQIYEIYESTATYGILHPDPQVVPTVVLCTGSEDL